MPRKTFAHLVTIGLLARASQEKELTFSEVNKLRGLVGWTMRYILWRWIRPAKKTTEDPHVTGEQNEEHFGSFLQEFDVFNGIEPMLER
jgi:hypothetical protein